LSFNVTNNDRSLVQVQGDKANTAVEGFGQNSMIGLLDLLEFDIVHDEACRNLLVSKGH
jgi:hypothetical protein